MALANFFDKAALSASQILKDFNRIEFEGLLESHRIGVVFDSNAASCSEGRATLDLLVRLLARLYPNLQIIDIDLNNNILVKQLEECARSINPVINLSKIAQPTVYLIIGNTIIKNKRATKFYLGSFGWTLKFSNSKPVGSGDSKNPFGAGGIACIGAANLFRLVFKEQLSSGDYDKDFTLSLFDFIKDDKNNEVSESSIENINLDNIVLVGIGAIGNATVWALSQIPYLTGNIEIVDPQTIDKSNLQRYVLATQDDITKHKVLVANEFIKNSKLIINQNPLSWAEYVQNGNDLLIKTVAVCVDSAKDRIVVQGSLPKKIFNAWTQKDDLGVSRHLNFLNYACLACLYIPDSKTKSKSEIIAESLGLADKEQLVRKYIANSIPINFNLLSLISTAKNIPIEKLLDFQGKNIQIFYSEIICGGVLLRLENKVENISHIEAPSAFESAFAGLLLAAELIIDAGQLRKSNLPIISRFNLLRPLNKRIHEEQEKHHSGKCICQDPDFQKVYKNKWDYLNSETIKEEIFSPDIEIKPVQNN